MSHGPMTDFDRQLLMTNKIGAETIEDLFEKERDIVDIRILELKMNPVDGNFDFNHLKTIHQRMFGDVYKTAGVDRYDAGFRGMFVKENLGAPGETMFVHGEKLKKTAGRLFDGLREKRFLKNLEQADFVQQAAGFFSDLNMLHPFREGNGRTQRIFMEQLAETAGYRLDLSRIPGDRMIMACQEASRGFPARLEILFRQNISPIHGYADQAPQRGLKEAVADLGAMLKKGFRLSHV